MRFLMFLVLILTPAGWAETHKEKAMSVAERFAGLCREWTEHCQKTSTSSQIEDSLRHPSFEGLVALGPAAVPSIMERYATDELCPWEFVLERITGVRFIEDRNEIVWGEVMNKRQAWWENEKKKMK